MKDQKEMVDKYGTTAKQRKMARLVAKDVLRSMKLYKVSRGHGYLTRPEMVDSSTPIQDAKKSVLKQCTVCALGAMFISRSRLFDKYTFGSPVYSVTRNDFGERNAAAIERAFELGETGEISANFPDESRIFGQPYPHARERLRAIMKNVIENKGVFRPDKDPRVVARMQADTSSILHR